MAATALVTGDLATGRAIIEEIERIGVVVDSALWLQDEDTGDWRLVIASPTVDRQGPRYAYERLSEVLATLGDSGLAIKHISVVGVADRFVRELKRVIGTSDCLHEIQLDYITIGGQSFKSARIFRVHGGKLEPGARVRVKANGQLGTVRKVVKTPTGPRYLVLYDLRPEDLRPLDGTPRSPVGQDLSADELDFQYVVRTGG